MKTLQLLSATVLMTLTSTSFANGDDDNNPDNSAKLVLTIIKIESPSCNGGGDGSATVQATGGVAPYTYNWNTFPAQSTAIATDLKSGTYFVQVKDANGDVIFTSIKVQDPTASIVDEFEPGTAGPIDITATVTGNNAPYIFELNGQSTDTEKIYNLPVGIHKLVITDANHCQMVQYIQVFEYESDNNNPSNPEKGFRINTSKEKLQSKNDKRVETSGLIPTSTVGVNGNAQILVTVSGH